MKTKETKRELRITIRLTHSDAEQIKKLACAAGFTLAHFVRQCLLGYVLQPRLTNEELFCLRQAVGMANNINQLTKLAHIQEGVSVELKTVLSALNSLLDKLKTK